MLSSFKVEIKEFLKEGEVAFYRVVEKRYFLGIRVYSSTHMQKHGTLRGAERYADSLIIKLEKEYELDIKSGKTVSSRGPSN